MQSREVFIRRWASHTAGLIAIGSAKMRKAFLGPCDSSEHFGRIMLEVDDTAKSLLGQLYDSLIQEEKPAR